MNQITSMIKYGLASLTIVSILGWRSQVNLAVASMPLPQTTAIPDTVDGRRYQQIMQDAVQENLSQASVAVVIQAVAEKFLGAKYQAGLLDKLPQETLVVSLEKFDCLLFVETVLAIANNIWTENYSYDNFTEQLENYRYWNGKINGYCSRLHYFSDWIDNNQVRGNLTNITPQLGGINIIKKLNFMTANRQLYPQLASSDANFKCIAQVESSLGSTLNYIPKQKIQKIYAQLQPGDIIGVTTNIAGLDFTHTGFVYLQADGNVGLIHASPAGQVVIAKDLQNYVENVKHATGIVVSRVNKSKLL